METALKITAESWEKLKTTLREKFPILTESDLTFWVGQEDELLTKLSQKLGKTKMEVDYLLEDLQIEAEETEIYYSEEEEEEELEEEELEEEEE